jgi:RNA polymerase sigma-70 factor (ECF subfamily)
MVNAVDFKTEFLALLPALRAFTRALCRNPAAADDLAQETLLRAWAHRDSFTLGTNLRAWIFTIARNAFYSGMRRRTREVEDPDGINANNVAVPPRQHDGLDLEDLERGLGLLPSEQREALMLVGASECSYEEAAAICGCAIGTIKSRVSRARRTLLAYLEGTQRPQSDSRSEAKASESPKAGAASRPAGPAAAPLDDASEA